MGTELFDALIKVRRSDDLLHDVPGEWLPKNIAEAYAISDALYKESGKSTRGWKIGATVPPAQEALKLSSPFAGRVLSGRMFRSPYAMDALAAPLAVEVEFAFEIGADLKKRGTPYDADFMVNVVRAVYPALEINYPHYDNPMALGGLSAIADNGVNYGLVLGAPQHDWSRDALLTHHARLEVNGDTLCEGSCAEIHFDPFEMLAWLANFLNERHEHLRQEDIVTAGSILPMYQAEQGAHILAHFSGFGCVEFRVT